MTREEREAKRQEIQRQTEEFLKAGGKIIKEPMGRCTDKQWNYNPVKDGDIMDE